MHGPLHCEAEKGDAHVSPASGEDAGLRLHGARVQGPDGSRQIIQPAPLWANSGPSTGMFICATVQRSPFLWSASLLLANG